MDCTRSTWACHSEQSRLCKYLRPKHLHQATAKLMLCDPHNWAIMAGSFCKQNSCFAIRIIEQLWLVPFANTLGLIHWKVNLSLQNCTVDGEFILYIVQSTCFEILIVVIFVVTIVFLSFEIDWWDNLGWILTCVNLRITAAIAATIIAPPPL